MAVDPRPDDSNPSKTASEPASNPDPDSAIGGFGFERALDELESISRELEEGRLDLDAALARYERGVALLTRCHALLAGAERRTRLLTGFDESGAPILEDFNAEPTAERRPGG